MSAKPPEPDRVPDPPDEPPADPIADLHRQVDHATASLDALHRDRLRCRLGCSSCCIDDLTVFPVEADLIRRHHADLLGAGTPHPEGACAFLDDRGACRIYEHRPYVCRTQGYPLRWLDETDDDEMTLVELRDLCPLNDEAGPPIEELPAEHCWTLGPVEQRLAEIQTSLFGDASASSRVRLRDLFSQATPGAITDADG